MKWTSNYSAGGACVVGCTGSPGTAANELFTPRDLKFDQHGNLYVSDQRNNRIQKFSIQYSFPCGKLQSSPTMFHAIPSEFVLIFSWLMQQVPNRNMHD